MDIRVKSIYVVRRKKLKGGRTAIRSLRTLRRLSQTIEPAEGGRQLIVDILDPHVKGQFIGLIYDEGHVTFTPRDIEFSGYMKGRGFEITGYDLEARRTTLNARAKHDTPTTMTANQKVPYYRVSSNGKPKRY